MNRVGAEMVQGQEFLLRWRGFSPWHDIEQEDMRMAEDAIKGAVLKMR